MAVFSLIHASDFHIGVKADFCNGFDIGGFPGWFRQAFSRELTGAFTPSTFWLDRASRFTHEMEQETDDIDAILVTGDIATTGSNSDITAAANFLDGTVPYNWVTSKRAFRCLHSDFLPPIILMPGNHDRYVPPALTPRSLEFEAAFGLHWNFNEPIPPTFQHHRFVNSFTLSRDGDSLILCTVDFSLTNINDAKKAGRAGFGYLGQGIVKKQQYLPYERHSALDELIEQSSWALENRKNCSVVWCIHFPPKYPKLPLDMQLIDENFLLEAAENLGIKLILSGHTHKYSSYLATPATRVVCCGTTTARSTAGEHQYLRLDLDTNNLLDPKVVRKVWDSTSMSFR